MDTRNFNHLFEPAVISDFKKPIKSVNLTTLSKSERKELIYAPKKRQEELFTKWATDMDPVLRGKIMDHINAFPEGMRIKSKRRIIKKKFGIKVF